jgi:nicotinate-nucleotide--dimethylbenzimidazole phosphoribosyltransferase
MISIQKRLDLLTKPLGSLGKLETIVKRIGAIQNTSKPCVDKRAIIIMAADNGVVDQGISPSKQSITKEVVVNFTRGITGINVFSRLSQADLHIVDIGIIGTLSQTEIYQRKIREGTNDISIGPAMSCEEAEQAIKIGIDMMKLLKKKGYHIVGTGEMGVGNTTTSSAVATALTGLPANMLVGRGAGLDKKGCLHKIDIVEKAIMINRPNGDDPIDILAKVGGFDIAGLVGCYIGAAIYKIPIVMDGFISSVAALCAVKIDPRIKQYIFPSHGSAEPGARYIFDALEMEPMLSLDMHLGEGTGAALGLYLMQAAIMAYNEMGTFSEANIESYVPELD